MCVCVCVCVWLCCTVCGILVPWPGIKPVSPAMEAQSLNPWTTREVPGKILPEKLWRQHDPADTWSRLLASRTMRECISTVFSHLSSQSFVTAAPGDLYQLPVATPPARLAQSKRPWARRSCGRPGRYQRPGHFLRKEEGRFIWDADSFPPSHTSWGQTRGGWEGSQGLSGEVCGRWFGSVSLRGEEGVWRKAASKRPSPHRDGPCSSYSCFGFKILSELSWLTKGAQSSSLGSPDGHWEGTQMLGPRWGSPAKAHLPSVKAKTGRPHQHSASRP